MVPRSSIALVVVVVDDICLGVLRRSFRAGVPESMVAISISGDCCCYGCDAFCDACDIICMTFVCQGCARNARTHR